MRRYEFHAVERYRGHRFRAHADCLDPQPFTEEVPRAQRQELHHKVEFLGLPPRGYRHARSAIGNMANEDYRRGEEAAWEAAHHAQTHAEIWFAWSAAVKIERAIQMLDDLMFDTFMNLSQVPHADH